MKSIKLFVAYMASEMINRVQSAEEKAEQAMIAARCHADEIISAAEKRIAEADASAKNQAEIKAGRIIDTAEGMAREKSLKAEREAVLSGEKMKTAAKEKQPEVTKAVLSIILS